MLEHYGNRQNIAHSMGPYDPTKDPIDQFLERTFQIFQRTANSPNGMWSRIHDFYGLAPETQRKLGFVSADEFKRTLAAQEMAKKGRGIPIDLNDEGDNVIVHAEIPGIDSKNITVELDKDMFQHDLLKITANVEIEESTENNSNDYAIKERRVGSIGRKVSLHHNVDAEATTAIYKDGVLKITLPKVEKSKLRQIPIN